MAFLAPVVGFLGSAAGIGTVAAVTTGASLLRGSPKVQQAQSALTGPSRSEAAARVAAADGLARRRGARGMRRTGQGGAEAQTGPTTSLLGRSG